MGHHRGAASLESWVPKPSRVPGGVLNGEPSNSDYNALTHWATLPKSPPLVALTRALPLSIIMIVADKGYFFPRPSLIRKWQGPGKETDVDQNEKQSRQTIPTLLANPGLGDSK